MTIAIILLAVGLILIVLELIFPSLGALGVAAALCLIASVSFAFAEAANSPPPAMEEPA